ncbi:MAG: DUF4139 domain-containing protein [Myxococcales bacterium]|nr:DUF4139 domain-containing protein [Myxococcales bacterium]
MRLAPLLSLLALLSALSACGASGRSPLPTTVSPLSLRRVVLYRNGVGYFERAGKLEGKTLRLRVRKDQVDDLLKSLAVVDRGRGRVLSVSIPLDPESWQTAALSALRPGSGNLAEVLDALRGTFIVVETKKRTAQGRIVMVEEKLVAPEKGLRPRDAEPAREHILSLLDGDELHVVQLSKIQSLILRDGDVAMQLHRHLDASAGEGMFQQVELSLRLRGDAEHDLLLSYVSAAPLWKPTYRIVLDPDNPGQALLQAWAVVDNVSGENWDGVKLSLTSGQPLAFRYDLHTPREVPRPDLTQSGVHKRARVALGERSFDMDEAMEEAAAEDGKGEMDMAAAEAPMAESLVMEKEVVAPKKRKRTGKADVRSAAGGGFRTAAAPAPPRPEPAPPSLTDSMLAASEMPAPRAQATRVAGLTRFDLEDRLDLPDGSSTMVALIDQRVPGEQVFLFKPGGSGPGYETNPYRVVRFKNDTDFALEPGPISIYADGSFVGEGLSEAVGSHERATIPFAVEPAITVRSETDHERQSMRVIKIVRGVLEVEAFERVETTWTVSAEAEKEVRRVLIRHPRRGGRFKLFEPPPGVEELPDAYFVPIELAAGTKKAKVRVVERTPSRTEISIWDGRAVELLDTLLASGNLDAKMRAKLQPVVEKRRAMGRIDTEIQGLEKQRRELDGRAEETRTSLKAIQKDPGAGALRRRLGERLEGFLSDGDKAGRRIVELQSERLQLKIELEDLLEKF